MKGGKCFLFHFCFFRFVCVTRQISVPWLGIESRSLTEKAWVLTMDHRGIPYTAFLKAPFTSKDRPLITEPRQRQQSLEAEQWQRGRQRPRKALAAFTSPRPLDLICRRMSASKLPREEGSLFSLCCGRCIWGQENLVTCPPGYTWGQKYNPFVLFHLSRAYLRVLSKTAPQLQILLRE